MMALWSLSEAEEQTLRCLAKGAMRVERAAERRQRDGAGNTARETEVNAFLGIPGQVDLASRKNADRRRSR